MKKSYQHFENYFLNFFFQLKTIDFGKKWLTLHDFMKKKKKEKRREKPFLKAKSGSVKPVKQFLFFVLFCCCFFLTPYYVLL